MSVGNTVVVVDFFSVVLSVVSLAVKNVGVVLSEVGSSSVDEVA